MFQPWLTWDNSLLPLKFNQSVDNERGSYRATVPSLCAGFNYAVVTADLHIDTILIHSNPPLISLSDQLHYQAIYRPWKFYKPHTSVSNEKYQKHAADLINFYSSVKKTKIGFQHVQPCLALIINCRSHSFIRIICMFVHCQINKKQFPSRPVSSLVTYIYCWHAWDSLTSCIIHKSFIQAILNKLVTNYKWNMGKIYMYITF